MNRFFIAIILILTISGCAEPREDTFPEIVGASYVPPQLDLCADYGSPTYCEGFQIHYTSWGGEGRVYQSRGLDFHAEPGTPVISASYGWVYAFRIDDDLCGGQVIIDTDIDTNNPRSTAPVTREVYLTYSHIVPVSGIAEGRQVKPGDLIGYMQQPTEKQKPCFGIGVNVLTFMALIRLDTLFEAHVDPNKFWADGPGIVTCFDPNKPPPRGTLVAPLRCE